MNISRRSELRTSIDVLRDCLDRGLTGSVLRVSDRGDWQVFLMQGEILAAHGPNDGQSIVRLLLNGGAIAPRQAERLLADLRDGQQLEGLLLGRVPEDLFLDLLAQRFRQNLLDFIRGDGPVEFRPLDAVFVENIQTGYDSNELLRELGALAARLAPLVDQTESLTLSPGRTPPSSPTMARLLDLCGNGCSLATLLSISPYEAGVTLDLVLAMSERGSLRIDGLTPLTDAVAPTVESAPASEGSTEADHSITPLEVIDLDFDSLQPISDPEPPMALQAEEASLDDDAANTIPPVDEDEPSPSEDQTEEAPLHARGRGAAPPAALKSFLASSAESDSLASGETEPDLADELDPAVQQAMKQGLADRDRRAAAAQFQEPADEGITVSPPGFDFDLPDDQLAFFSDQDQVRGGGEGTFVSDTELLDKVDLSTEGMAAFQRALQLAGQAPPEEDLEALPMGEASEDEVRSAVSLTFGGPKLGEGDLQHKFDVVNEVLSQIAAVIDRENGPGSGRLHLQLLVDGPPARFGVLFRGVQVDEAGHMDVARLLKNLKKRPEAEHRRLTTESLNDLVQRVLSTCVDELPEESVDEMLEKIAGYQHRLGF